MINPKLEQERQELIKDLTAKRDELVERLDRGAARIEDARAQGRNVHDWETYWLQLLKQYEKVCDQLTEVTGVEVSR